MPKYKYTKDEWLLIVNGLVRELDSLPQDGSKNSKVWYNTFNEYLLAREEWEKATN